MPGMNPEEEKEFDEGVLGAIDSGLELSGTKVEPVKPDEEEVDPDAPPAPELNIEAEPEKKPEPDADPDPDKKPKEDDDPDPKPDEDPKPEDHAAGDPEDSEGTPVPKKEDDPAAPIKDAKPSDEFGELEEDAPVKTKERFDTMKSRFDEVSTELGRVNQQNTDWMDTIQRTGASPEQLGASLSYLEDINTGTPESLERAYQTMQGELGVLAKALGKEAPGFDPLDDHPDLKHKFDEGELSREDALELAGSRTRANFKPVTAAAPQNNQEQGTAALSALGSRLRAGDAQYEEKLPQINQIVEDVVKSGADPSTWANLVESAYKRIQLAPKAAVVKTPVPNAIRPGASGKTGEFNKEPGNILDAVNQSLDQGF